MHLQDEDDEDPIETTEQEVEFNELEAKRTLFKFSKQGDSGKLENLLNIVLQKFKDEKQGTRNISISNNKYKTKFERFLNQRDERGNTPQHYAAKGGHLEVLRVLDEKGANLQAKGQNNLKVIQFAARYGENEKEVWKCIEGIREMEKPTIWKPLSKGLDIGEQDKYGFNILHQAIQNEHWRDKEDSSTKSDDRNQFRGSFIIKEILNLKDIKVGHSDFQENNTLHLALLHKKPEVAAFILGRAKGIPEKEKKLREVLKQKNKGGKMPLHIACQKSNTDDQGLTNFTFV